MTPDIALFIGLDGIVTGALYAALAIGLIVVFAVTRIIFVPIGEFVTFGALTLAALADGRVPGTAVLMPILGLAAFLADRWQGRRRPMAGLWRGAARDLGLPGLVYLATLWLAPLKPGLAVTVPLTFALVVPLGSQLYRLAFRPLADQSVLVLFIAAIGLHLALTGLGLIAFGPEGYKVDAFWEASFDLGPVPVTGQSVLIIGTALALMLGLWLFLGATRAGKALRAVAINRTGARLVGIPTDRAGEVALLIAAAIGTLSGLMIITTTTVFYDTGFIIGLKGFVAAIVAGLGSAPMAVAAAVFVGLVESFAAFWASAFREAIVFSLIVPVLVWRSVVSPAHDEEV